MKTRMHASLDPSTRVTLLKRVRCKLDDEAWVRFVNVYNPLIVRHCKKFGLQDADTHDVAQAVFRNLAQSLDRFVYEPSRGRFRSWMGVVVNREIRRYVRCHARPGAAPGDGAHEPLLNGVSRSLDPSWCDDFNHYLLHRAWNQIQPLFDQDTCVAFERSWMENIDPTEVASNLDKPVAWVYKARFRVLRRLKIELRTLCLEQPLLSR